MSITTVNSYDSAVGRMLVQDVESGHLLSPVGVKGNYRMSQTRPRQRDRVQAGRPESLGVM